LEFYVNLVGIPVRDVLRWATINGAALMNRDHEIGAVRPAYLADLIVLDGNPLGDIGLVKDPRRILAVMKGGQFFKDQLTGLDGEGGEPNLAAAPDCREPAVANR
jgi:imidazolonepropionase-like amidohydrolase